MENWTEQTRDGKQHPNPWYISTLGTQSGRTVKSTQSQMVDIDVFSFFILEFFFPHKLSATKSRKKRRKLKGMWHLDKPKMQFH